MVNRTWTNVQQLYDTRYQKRIINDTDRVKYCSQVRSSWIVTWDQTIELKIIPEPIKVIHFY